MSYPPASPAVGRTHSQSHGTPAPATPSGSGSMPTYVVGGSRPFSIQLATPNNLGSGADTPGNRRRSAAAAGLPADHDYLEFTPLGSGCEVGRSCHILRFKGKTIMLDGQYELQAKGNEHRQVRRAI